MARQLTGVASSDRALLDRYRNAVRACAVMNLRQAARVVTRYFDEQLKSTGLRVTQLNLLMAIEVAGPPTMTNLADILAMDRTTLTRNLKLLRIRKLVEPTRIALTQKGRRAAAEALPIWQQAQAQVTRTLGDKRWEAMLVELAATRAAVRSIPARRVRRGPLEF